MNIIQQLISKVDLSKLYDTLFEDPSEIITEIYEKLEDLLYEEIQKEITLSFILNNELLTDEIKDLISLRILEIKSLIKEDIEFKNQILSMKDNLVYPLLRRGKRLE